MEKEKYNLQTYRYNAYDFKQVGKYIEFTPIDKGHQPINIPLKALVSIEFQEKQASIEVCKWAIEARNKEREKAGKPLLPMHSGFENHKFKDFDTYKELLDAGELFEYLAFRDLQAKYTDIKDIDTLDTKTDKALINIDVLMHLLKLKGLVVSNDTYLKELANRNTDDFVGFIKSKFLTGDYPTFNDYAKNNTNTNAD
jgi:hypothetical protein